MNTDAGLRTTSAADVDPRAALLLLLCVCAVIVASPTDARLAAIAAGIVLVAGLQHCLPQLLRRLLLLLPMSIGLGVHMFFTAGDSGMAIGRESPDALAMSVGTVSRLLLIAAASMLFGLIVPIQRLATALRVLKVPASAVSVLWMTERLFLLLIADARRMLEAVRVRSTSLSLRFRIMILSRIAGAFLVRAVSRSDRMADALLARGFDGNIPVLHPLRWQVTDTLICCSAAALLLIIWLPS
ncbi:MAG: energy-coupling factor transporter transmembrane protein EcfT [Bacteroidia bacterium]|nr:energy-coupling factor transporter transmembrane protein EcfT [Bacteroidia bacterium]